LTQATASVFHKLTTRSSTWGYGALGGGRREYACAADWIVILRDRRIRHRPAERDALARHHLRVLVMTGAGNLSVWDQLRLLVRSWDHIEQLVEAEPGPWLFSIIKAGLRCRSYPTPEQ